MSPYDPLDSRPTRIKLERCLTICVDSKEMWKMIIFICWKRTGTANKKGTFSRRILDSGVRSMEDGEIDRSFGGVKL